MPPTGSRIRHGEIPAPATLRSLPWPKPAPPWRGRPKESWPAWPLRLLRRTLPSPTRRFFPRASQSPRGPARPAHLAPQSPRWSRRICVSRTGEGRPAPPTRAKCPGRSRFSPHNSARHSQGPPSGPPPLPAPRSAGLRTGPISPIRGPHGPPRPKPDEHLHPLPLRGPPQAGCSTRADAGCYSRPAAVRQLPPPRPDATWPPRFPQRHESAFRGAAWRPARERANAGSRRPSCSIHDARRQNHRPPSPHRHKHRGHASGPRARKATDDRAVHASRPDDHRAP